VDPIFCRTRHDYGSYVDFWRLVEAAKFPTCFVDEIDPDSNRTYVFTPLNGEWRGLGKRRAKIIWWNLERPQDDTLDGSLERVAGTVDEIWVSDRWYASRDPRFKYVQIAGHPDFATRTTERNWDICPLAYLWGRRKDAISVLESKGYKITPGAWGRSDQDKFVATSRLMLNLHQYAGLNTVAPIRFAIAASYAIPIVSEPFNDVVANELVIATVAIERLPIMIDRIFDQQGRLAEMGQELHHKLCIETDFRREIERKL